MSKAKTPQEKKALSLTRDRRNVFGESPHAARKRIPLSKQAAHQELRRIERETLGAAVRDPSDDATTEVVNTMLDRRRETELVGFKKKPDAPLGQVIARKKAKRARRSSLGSGSKSES